ncbi:histidine phosphatase family protein [Caulobacter sp. LARHSG274]
MFFVRHGAHDRLGRVLCGRMEAVSVSEHGLAQADAAARRLRDEPIAAVYVSPMTRAAETARPIAAAHGLQPRTDEALNEIDLGVWTGAVFEDLDHAPEWGWWNASRGQHRAPGGESMLEVQLRVANWMEAARRRHADQAIVAVSHADVTKAALCHALGLCLDHHGRIEVAPGSISTVVAAAWGLKVHSINEAPA